MGKRGQNDRVPANIRFYRGGMPQTVFNRRFDDRVRIVTEEPAAMLAPLAGALADSNLSVEIVPPQLASAVAPSVAYLRLGIRTDMTGPVDGFHELRPLEGSPERVVNTPSSLQIAHHLLLTGRALEQAGVPHASVTGVFEPVAANGAADRIGYPLVLRPPYGAAGRFAVAVRDREALAAALEQVVPEPWFERSGLTLQRFIPDAADVSVLVVDGSVVAATLVVTEPDPTRGGVGVRFDTCPTYISARAEGLAVAAVGAVGGDVMAAHLLFGTDGTVVVGDVCGVPDLSLYAGQPGVLPEIARAIGRRIRQATNPAASRVDWTSVA